MSFFNHPQAADFPIHEDSLPPATVHQLIADQGFDAVRQALPRDERAAFDAANPREDVRAASNDVTYHTRELAEFDRRTTAGLPASATPEQIRAAYEAAQPLREDLVADLAEARQELAPYAANLVTHIESRGLLPTVLRRTGMYSTREQNAAAVAHLVSPGGSRSRHRPHNSHGGSRSSRPSGLAESRGDRRQARSHR
ncbi:hypothetical protein ABT336_01640 [Micromonospora sp. NPDC000207]|uniref:hypothetical protein n=1 Tax=Micromonospora sp. NPDC000207 TaxID=3154246 RepID=UPI0033165D5D